MPASAVSVPSSRALPEIDGGVALAGGAGSTSAVAAEAAVPDPPVFTAVTTTRSAEPVSGSVGV